MEKYKLKKDTFFNKAGTICKLTPKGNMVLDNCEGACILHNYQLKEHPELLDEWFEKIEEKKYGGRAPKRGDKYWVVCGSGVIESDDWEFDNLDESSFECGSAFWTEEEAERELARRKAYVILKEDTKGFKPDWGDNDQTKYYVFYHYGFRGLRATFTFLSKGESLYFETIEDADSSIRAHRQQWLDYLGIEVEV